MFDAAYIIELDSLYRNEHVTKGAVEFTESLSANHLPYVIITEQTGRERNQIARKLNDHGLRTVRPGDIYTSAMAAVDYLLSISVRKRRALMIGGRGLKAALDQGGFVITEDHPDYLFVAMNRNMTYSDYCGALEAINDGAQIISTDNRRTQWSDGNRIIGNASIVHMLEYASETRAISTGRGSRNLFLSAQNYLQKRTDEILMVGTSFRTDILPAEELGYATCLVTEGRDITEMGVNEDTHPDYIVEDLAGLTK